MTPTLCPECKQVHGDEVKHWYCPTCRVLIAPELVVKMRVPQDDIEGWYHDAENGPSGGPWHKVTCDPAEFHWNKEPAAAEEPAPEPSDADKAAEAAHDALMARLIEAVYIMGVSCTKLANVPAQFIPRVLVCAAVRGIEKSLENFLRVSEPENPRAASRQQIAALQARLTDDMVELSAALTEATDSLATLRAELNVPQSNLVS